MRYAVILAGGSGTRLWPMSRHDRPKQLIPLIEGRSLLEIARRRLEGLLPDEQLLVCAGRAHAAEIFRLLPELGKKQFLGEPCGRDTLGAIGLCAAVLARRDPEAIVAIFTADHVIEPIDRFQQIVVSGYELVERRPEALVTFGIAPTHPATGYGYLELGEPLDETSWRLKRFREKPERPAAEEYCLAGPQRFLWNSGMLVYKASTLIDAIRRHAPEDCRRLLRVAEAWDAPGGQKAVDEIFPTLTKTSIEFAVLESASVDPAITLAAIPMPLRWLDVGSWTSLAETCRRDERGNTLDAEKTAFVDTRNTIAVSDDPNHLIAALGCDDLVIVHAPDATFVCRRDRVDDIKRLHRQVVERWGERFA
ncbi:MAG: NTP transferase domain-containing protein [Pirellulales bacterium]|nr:NTP transferase domain-containing protein [Pirellulales bacterium]